MTPDDLLARIRIVGTSAVTVLVALSTFITAVSPELPEDWQMWAARAVAWLGTAVLIIRRVSPVEPEKRGVLPAVRR